MALNDLRPVYVIGIGMHPYQNVSETPYGVLGLTAARAALDDAAIAFSEVESSYIATAMLPLAPGRAILRHLGATGAPLVHIENASASGSAAFRQACIDVASGISDVSLALGVDKPKNSLKGERIAGVPFLAEDYIVPFTHFAMLADNYMKTNRVSPEDVALIAVKNLRNGALNPYAQRRQERTLEEVLSGKSVSGSITALQCCPVGEGAAATIVASGDAIHRLGIDPGRVIRVAASATRSQRVYDDAPRYDSMLTQETTALALRQAQRNPAQLDLIELHDAFSIEELEYVEVMGVVPDGQAVSALKDGMFDIGGKCAVSASGGLIAMGHPVGPTGLGQINELTLQLRHEAGARQQPDAKIALAHMVGVGSICYAHVLERP
ncbi:thiolase family protein [Rhodococcus opacus]